MKKLIALLLALVMVLGLVACGAKEEAAPEAAAPEAAAPEAKEELETTPAAEEIVEATEGAVKTDEISSEMPEILGMCDRIMVMHEGHKMGELMVEEASQEKIMAMCT